MAKKRSKACARPGALTTKQRNSLPASAFGLQSERTYPLYKPMADGSIAPSATHARAAKARAEQELDKGKLTRQQYNTVVRRAEAVQAKCSVAAQARRKKADAKKGIRGGFTKKQRLAALEAKVRRNILLG